MGESVVTNFGHSIPSLSGIGAMVETRFRHARILGRTGNAGACMARTGITLTWNARYPGRSPGKTVAQHAVRYAACWSAQLRLPASPGGSA